MVSCQVGFFAKPWIKGHTDPRCKELFDPSKNPKLKDVNTQVAEQTFSWFSKFKHIGRYMNRVIYWIFIIGMFHARNMLTVERVKERAARKRKCSSDMGVKPSKINKLNK